MTLMTRLGGAPLEPLRETINGTPLSARILVHREGGIFFDLPSILKKVLGGWPGFGPSYSILKW